MKVPFRLHLDEPLRIASGLPSLTADDTVVRGASGPIVPSTTIKGAVRAAAAGICDPALSEADLRSAFGGPDGPRGAIAFTDAHPAPGLEPVVDEVTRVSLSEARTAVPGRLMTVEVVRPLARTAEGLRPLVFVGEARILVEDPDDRLLRVLLFGLANLRALGGQRSRGHGGIRVALDPGQVARALEVAG